jgi:hypothetical protein
MSTPKRGPLFPPEAEYKLKKLLFGSRFRLDCFSRGIEAPSESEVNACFPPFGKFWWKEPPVPDEIVMRSVDIERRRDFEESMDPATTICWATDEETEALCDFIATGAEIDNEMRSFIIFKLGGGEIHSPLVNRDQEHLEFNETVLRLKTLLRKYGGTAGEAEQTIAAALGLELEALRQRMKRSKQLR